MIEDEPTQNPDPPPNWRKSVVVVIGVILGVCLIAFPLHSILRSVLDLPSLPFSGIVLAILAIIVLVRWRSWAKKHLRLSSSPSPEMTGPRPRAIFGGISLACAVVGVFCLAACYFHFSGSNAALSLFVLGFLLAFPALGFGIVSLARREQPKWPAAVGGLIGASPFVIFIMAVIHMLALQPMIERVGHASLSDSPAKTAPAHPPTANGTPPMRPADAPAKSSGSPTDRLLSDDRLQWCAEAQAAVESWLRNDTNNFFTPEYGTFVSLQGTGLVRSSVWNIQGYDYITLHRTGQFTDGTIPVTIYVTEGAVTAPGQTTVGTPALEGPVTSAQGARIFISHPKVGRGVQQQTKTEATTAQASPKAFERSLEDNIIKRRQFEQAVERWGDEGMTAIAAFLKSGTNEISALCGEFVCFQNEDYPKYSLFTPTDSSGNDNPFQLHVRVRALFSGGYLPLYIRMIEGRTTGPELSTVGIPTLHGRVDLHSGATLIVPHPQLCSFERFQGQDNLVFLAAEGEARLIGTYSLRSPVSPSSPPCTLELRPDHSLTLSNCPTPSDPQRRVTIPGEWSLSVHRGRGIFFQLSVSGGEAVTLRRATCNLVDPPLPGAFRATVRLACRDGSGAQKELEFVADKSIPSPFMPRDNPLFVRRKPAGNPPHWDTPVYRNPRVVQAVSNLNHVLNLEAKPAE